MVLIILCFILSLKIRLNRFSSNINNYLPRQFMCANFKSYIIFFFEYLLECNYNTEAFNQFKAYFSYKNQQKVKN